MWKIIHLVGWVGGFVRKYSHFVAPSVKLRLARFSEKLETFQLGPNMAIIVNLVFTRFRNIILCVLSVAKNVKILAKIYF